MAEASTLEATTRPSLSAITGGAPALPLLLMLAITAIDGLDNAMFGALLPEIRDWFGVSLATALGLQSVAALLIVFAAIPIGYVCDRTNRVRLTVIAGIAWGAMAFATGLAPTLFLLYVARFGAGLTGAVGPAHTSLLADWYPPEARSGVYSVFGASKPIGAFVGPLLGGYLASWLTWQVPFLLFGIPSVLVSIWIALRLREPVRGAHERAALGIADTDEQAPPSFAEGWRIAKSVRTLRRIWWALPFLAGGFGALGNFLGVYFDEVFHLGTAARGNIIAANQPFLLVGLFVGALAGNRLIAVRPARLVTYVGLIGVAQAASIGLVAVAPTWWLAVIPLYLGTAVGAVLQPSLFALLTLVIPPRIRGASLGFAGLFVAPGLLIAPLMGQVADSLGTRWGIAACIPFFLVGSLIIASAGVSIDADIRQARAAAAAASASNTDVDRPLLVVRDVDVHFGGVQVLFGVDLDVVEGEILALLGTNGAGKSTLLRAIAGTVTPSSGAVFLDGDDVTFLPAAAHAARGVAQVQGGRGVFPNLTVGENVRLAAWGMNADEADTRFATDGVTTVIFHNQLVNVLVAMQQADTLQYTPEWLMIGHYAIDVNLIGATFPPRQAAHVFGLSTTQEWPQTPANGECYQAVRSIRPNHDPGGSICGQFWLAIVLLASGVQGAGPTLTPASFTEALYALGHRYGQASWAIGGGFGPDDLSYTDDVGTVWWSATAANPTDGTLGAYVWTHGGRRFQRGQLPTGDDPELFTGGRSTAPNR